MNVVNFTFSLNPMKTTNDREAVNLSDHFLPAEHLSLPDINLKTGQSCVHNCKVWVDWKEDGTAVLSMSQGSSNGPNTD